MFPTGVALAQSPDKGGDSRAQQVKQCFTAHEKAQEERTQSRFLDARKSLLQCSNAVCPSLVRQDCLEWYADVQRSMPSIVISARAGSEDITDVKVTIDGSQVATELAGHIHELDPGKHEFLLEAEGLDPLRKTIMVSVGDKGRLVVFRFPVEEESKSAVVGGGVAPPPVVPTVPMHRPVQMSTYVLGGAGVLFTAGAVVSVVLAQSEESDLKGSCAPNCTDDEVSSAKTFSGLAVGSAVLALGGAAGALITYLTRPEVPIEKAQAPVGFWMGSNRGGLTLKGTF